jgi:hypothetical protein
MVAQGLVTAWLSCKDVPLIAGSLQFGAIFDGELKLWDAFGKLSVQLLLSDHP